MTWLATDFRHERKWKMAQVRIHFIIVMIRWTGVAPWEFEFPLLGSLTSTLTMPQVPFHHLFFFFITLKPRVE